MADSDIASYTQNTRHSAEAVDHLIELFKHGPRNIALVSAVGTQIQQLEDELWKLRSAFLVDSAVNSQLDIVGSWVKEDRKGRSDAAYRAIIRVRILDNTSDGFPVQMEAIAQALLPAQLKVYREYFPATLYFDFTSVSPLTLSELYYELKRAAPAGTKILTTYGGGLVGAVDGTPFGGVIGAVDGSPLGFAIGAGL